MCINACVMSRQSHISNESHVVGGQLASKVPMSVFKSTLITHWELRVWLLH